MVLVFSTVPAAARNHIAMSLQSDGAHVAIIMTPEPGWHGYWKNPGDAGVANQFDWTVPNGLTLGPLRYPVPERLVVSGLMNHVYTGEHTLFARWKVANSHPGMRLPISVKGRWLACTDRICVPEEGSASGDITVGLRPDPDWSERLRALPLPLGSPAHWQAEGGNLRIAIPLPANIDTSQTWFFAESEGLIAYGGAQRTQRSGDMLIIDAKAASDALTAKIALRGVLALGSGQGLEIEAKPGAIVSQGGSVLHTALLAFLGAVAGGTMLNILPCVFPIISLKALSLARASGDAQTVKREALAYAAGAILACLALGGTLLGLRAGGAAVGWAFQLQDPRVILFLFLLTLAITLNLAGFFALKGLGSGEALAGQSGSSGAFWTGALAAFIATPCTGPFMAAALGAALVLPVAAALAIFGGLGLGLALPFVALAWWPALRNRLPRPGPWMVRFQRWMALPMALTALALVWLLERQSGTQGLIVAGALALVLVATVYGVRRARPSGVGLFGCLAGLALLAGIGAPLLPAGRTHAIDSTIAGAEPFSPVRLDALLNEKRPVFVYFTADWCVTCKVNERVALADAEVSRAFAAKHVAVLVGDWTRGDPEITTFLEANGRSGVPLYLYYPSGKTQPRILPQLLTPSMLTDL